MWMTTLQPVDACKQALRKKKAMDRAAKDLAKRGTITTTADALQLNIILVFVVHRLHCLYTNAAPP
jgi:hypothetical protein